MVRNITPNRNTQKNLAHSYRDLALEGLIIEAFNEFDFFQNEEGDVLTGIESDECTEVLSTCSVSFEYLYRYFAESMGIRLSDDEWIVQLIKIERFIQGLEDEFICDDCLEQMETVA